MINSLPVIKQNVDGILRRIDAAARRAGLPADGITIVAVTKNVPVDAIRDAVDCLPRRQAGGIKDIGENRVQEAKQKYAAIGNRVRWHMLGHLQTNKARDAVRIFDLIHSVDTLKIAQAVDSEAKKINKIQNVLVEVNTSGEQAKFGVAPAQLEPLLEGLDELDSISVSGLMTMAPAADDGESARPYFRRLKELFLALRSKPFKRVKMEYLSMGMSQDFEVAVEEGANILRIGRAIFGDYN